MNQKTDTNTSRSRSIYLLPNLFTLVALFAGFYAVVAAMQSRFEQAAIAIFIAILMDSLDGRVARLTNTQTAFGAQLDSLSDMVSFGVAPALVMYAWALIDLGKLGWLAVFLFAAAVALRLARFNISGSSDKRYFSGLPCPSAAAVVASMIWLASKYGLNGEELNWLVAIVSVALALLMVSNVKYRSFKDLDLTGAVPFIAIIIMVIVFVLIALNPPETLFIVSVLFAVSGPLMWLWHTRKNKDHASKESDHHAE